MFLVWASQRRDKFVLLPKPANAHTGGCSLVSSAPNPISHATGGYYDLAQLTPIQAATCLAFIHSSSGCGLDEITWKIPTRLSNPALVFCICQHVLQPISACKSSSSHPYTWMLQLGSVLPAIRPSPQACQRMWKQWPKRGSQSSSSRPIPSP